jgi:hypothetical protein
MCSLRRDRRPGSVVGFAVALAVMGILYEEVFVTAVSGKGNRRDAEAGEGALKSVPSAELTRVTPCLAVIRGQLKMHLSSFQALPRVWKLTPFPMDRIAVVLRQPSAS